MSVYLFSTIFYLLLPLLLCGTLYGHVCAAVGTETSTAKDSVDVFQINQKIGDALKPKEITGDKVADVTVKEFYSPVFVSVGDVLVALAAINNTEKIDNNITVLTKYLDTTNKDWGKNVFETSGGEWTTQFAVYKDCSSSCVDTSVVRGLVAAAKGDNKVYLLSVNASTKSPSSPSNGELTLEVKFGLAVGTVGADKKITWVEEKPLTCEGQGFTERLKEHKLSKGAFFGSALVTEEKILFLLRAHTNVKKTVFNFLYSDGGDSANKLQFLPFDGISQDCYPQFFLWETKIIMVPTECEGGVKTQNVKATADFTKEPWVDSPKPFSRFVDFFRDKSDFTTVSIQKNTNNNDVLLFTQKKKPKQPPAANKDNCDVYLWATDGKRFYNAGMFLNNVNVTSINLVYTKNELLALYQIWETNEPKNIFLMRLKTQLDGITTAINAWKSNDGIFEKLCDDKISCAPPLSTDGLVGFLANNSEEPNKIWKDEYYCANAIVTQNTKKVLNGFTFSGDGAGAKWRVGKDQNDQPYNFTNPGFTLLATVEIGKHNNEKTFDNSLLGLILKEGDKRIGLLCSGGNWAVGDKTRILNKSGEHKCGKEETYIVGLVLEKNRNLAIFVDGNKLNDLDVEALKIGEGKNITHFYFGADAEGAGGTQQLAKTDVTITNVLLYNRPVDEEEIKNIKAQKREKPEIPTPPINGTINTQEDGKSTGETDKTSSTPTTTEKDGAETKLCLSFMNSVTLLSLLLFVGFSLLGCYV